MQKQHSPLVVMCGYGAIFLLLETPCIRSAHVVGHSAGDRFIGVQICRVVVLVLFCVSSLVCLILCLNPGAVPYLIDASVSSGLHLGGRCTPSRPVIFY